MGIASPNAMAPPLPERIANVVPSTPPVITSGGMAAPTLIFPMKISSRVPPMMIPCCKSPSAQPTSGPSTRGLLSSVVPRKSSECPKTAIRVMSKKVTKFRNLNEVFQHLSAFRRNLTHFQFQSFVQHLPDQADLRVRYGNRFRNGAGAFFIADAPKIDRPDFGYFFTKRTGIFD